MEKRNPHLGSSFDDFLKLEGIFEEVLTIALVCFAKESIEDHMNAVHVLKRST